MIARGVVRAMRAAGRARVVCACEARRSALHSVQPPRRARCDRRRRARRHTQRRRSGDVCHDVLARTRPCSGLHAAARVARNAQRSNRVQNIVIASRAPSCHVDCLLSPRPGLHLRSAAQCGRAHAWMARSAPLLRLRMSSHTPRVGRAGQPGQRHATRTPRHRRVPRPPYRWRRGAPCSRRAWMAPRMHAGPPCARVFRPAARTT